MQHKPPTAIIKVEDLFKSFNGRSLLEDISFELAPGEAIAIIGPSGAGKTTLLKCINMLTPIDKGRVTLANQVVQDIDPNHHVQFLIHRPNTVRQRIGLVFQEWNLWPNMTVRQNIMEGPITVLRKSRGDASALAARLAAQVSISDKLGFYPFQLSGGQKQRVAIARALAMEPDVLMLDEITSALDPSLIGDMLDLITALRNSARALIIVTHHLEFARHLCNRILFLCNGHICEKGTSNDILDNPQTPELKQFLRKLERTK